jgi:geranylgeranyl diphosphate synthase type II
MDFERELKRRRDHVNEVIRSYLPSEEGFQKTLFEAVNYSMLAGGKRLRPLMIDCTYEMYGGQGKLAEPFMAGMEMIHTHSLIHDDLPAMDNDEYRRGMKTTHIMYGEAIAILAGDALLNCGYRTAASAFFTGGRAEDDAEEAVCCDAESGRRIARALRILTLKSGMDGMIGGQSCDVEYDGRPLSEGQLDFIYRYKTGALIEASLMIGAVLAGAPDRDVKKLEAIGTDVGVAFQIRDDILDQVSTTEELGKPAGSDEKNHKTTYVSLHGLEDAERQVELLSARALDLFDTLSAQHPFLRELLKQLIKRTK